MNNEKSYEHDLMFCLKSIEHVLIDYGSDY